MFEIRYVTCQNCGCRFETISEFASHIPRCYGVLANRHMATIDGKVITDALTDITLDEFMGNFEKKENG